MEWQLPPLTFAGYIFDCDGTLTDNMHLHFEAWMAALEPFGVPFTAAMHRSWGGMPNAAIVRRLSEQFGVSLDASEIIRRKNEHYQKIVHRVRPLEPVVKLVHELHGKARLAVASGGKRESVLATLRVLGLENTFDAIVTAEDYALGKPAPDPFLIAAERLGVPPEQCLVIEDSPTGEEAARRAGMAVVLVPAQPH